MTTLFHYIEFNTIYEFVLADGDHFYTGNDLRRDDLDLLVKTLTEFYGYAFRTTVVIDEDIAVIGTDKFLYCLVRRYDRIGFAQAERGRDIHTRTQEVLAVGDDDLHLEGMAGSVNGRINDFYRCREDLIGIDLRRPL